MADNYSDPNTPMSFDPLANQPPASSTQGPVLPSGYRLVASMPDTNVFEDPSGQRLVIPRANPLTGAPMPAIDAMAGAPPPPPSPGRLAFPSPSGGVEGMRPIEAGSVGDFYQTVQTPGGNRPSTEESVAWATRNAPFANGAVYASPSQRQPGQQPPQQAAQGRRATGPSGPRAPSARDRLLQSFDAEGRAIEQGARVRGDTARTQADLISRTSVDEGLLAEEQREQQEERARQLQSANQRLAAMQQKISSQEVDPDRLYEEKGVGGRIASALAVGLGAIGSAMTGGPNIALQIVQDAIDRDIEAQRENIGRGERDVERQRGAIAMMRDEFGDAEQREAAARAALWTDAERRVAAASQYAQGEAEQANAQQMLAGIQRQRAATEIQFQQASERANRPQGGRVVMVDGQPMHMSNAQYLQFRQQGAEQGDANTVPGLRVSDSRAAEALRPEDRTRVRTVAASGNAVLRDLNQLIDLRREHGAEMGDSDAAIRMNGLRDSIARNLGALEGAGAFGVEEGAQYRARVGDPTEWRVRQLAGQDPVTSRLEGLREMIQGRVEENVRPYGYTTEPEPQRESNVRTFQPARR